MTKLLCIGGVIDGQTVECDGDNYVATGKVETDGPAENDLETTVYGVIRYGSSRRHPIKVLVPLEEPGFMLMFERLVKGYRPNER